jgi:transposase-like protein
MERDWLAARLEEGRSIESIAREVGRAPSTVAYWVNKHGLASTHAARHAAKGGITRETLASLVSEGLSTRQIASRLALSQSAVRHWLRRHGLNTERAARRRSIELRISADSAEVATAVCPRHGTTQFRRRPDGGWRCLRCRADAVTARRRAVKSALVADAGGACAMCGYDRSLAALQFHHVDPSGKDFHIAQRGIARSLSAARDEAAKCVLLCANCHAEVEAGVATIPKSTGPRRPGERDPG